VRYVKASLDGDHDTADPRQRLMTSLKGDGVMMDFTEASSLPSERGVERGLK
jgi:hypothetical protein